MIYSINVRLCLDDETAILVDKLSSIAIAAIAILLALLHRYGPVLTVAGVKLDSLLVGGHIHLDAGDV